MRSILAISVAVLACASLAGCSEQPPDTRAAEAWFAEIESMVPVQWPERLISAGGGIVTEGDGEGLITAALGEARTVGEFLVACGGGGGVVKVFLRLDGAEESSSEDTVACTGDYTSVGLPAGPVNDVTSIVFGYSTPGDPVGVSLVVLGP